VRVLSTLVESYRLAHGERVRIEFVAEGAEIPVAADPVALQRAFRNVLDNAVKYTPAGGQVRVRASVVSQHAFDEPTPQHTKEVLYPPGRNRQLVILATGTAVRVHPDEPPQLVVSVMHDITDNEQFEAMRDQFMSAAAHNALALAGWFAGCTVIWSSLFTVGKVLYGRYTEAYILGGVFVVSGVVLLRVINKLWTPQQSASLEPQETSYVQ
jgi:hypothetical protein